MLIISLHRQQLAGLNIFLKVLLFNMDDVGGLEGALKALSLHDAGKGVDVRSSRDVTTPILVFFPPECTTHGSRTLGHQESPARLDVLCGERGVLRELEEEGVVVFEDGETRWDVEISDVLRVHDWAYVKHVSQFYENCRSRGKAATEGVYYLDSDTVLSGGSWTAARLAAGAAIAAVDAVLDESRFPNRAFVAARPPGHHAGPSGTVPAPQFTFQPDMCSCGFCLLNTVAIAAAYARYNYKSKVVIVDFDIHHGNGTEEIVRGLRPYTQSLPLPGSWAPVQREVYRPWLNESDADNVLLCSTHLYKGGQFYPGGGSSTAEFVAATKVAATLTRGEESLSNGAGEGGGATTPCIVGATASSWEVPPRKNGIINVALPAIGPNSKQGLSKKKFEDLCAKASKSFREKVEAELLPSIREFCPDIVFFSAGFDGHKDDLYWYLSEDDYRWLTREVIAAAGVQVPVVSVLEGGYQTDVSHRIKTQVEREVAAASGSTPRRNRKRKPPARYASPGVPAVPKNKDNEEESRESAEARGVAVVAASAATVAKTPQSPGAKGKVSAPVLTPSQERALLHGPLALSVEAHVRALLQKNDEDKTKV